MVFIDLERLMKKSLKRFLGDVWSLKVYPWLIFGQLRTCTIEPKPGRIVGGDLEYFFVIMRLHNGQPLANSYFP